MSYRTDKEREAEIRGWFTDHVATLSIGNAHLGDIDLIEWRKPGTGIDRVVYILLRGTLMVSGDLGDAVYQWPERISSKFIAQCELDYFASKCQASEYGRGGKEWNPDLARKYIEERIGHAYDDVEYPEYSKPPVHESADKLFEDAFGYHGAYEEITDSRGAWCNYLHHYSAIQLGILPTELFDYESGSIGMEPALGIRMHLIGMKMAYAQMSAPKMVPV